jgi:HK97 family phage major capsid protein
VWVGNSSTYGEIETLTTSGTGSDFAFGQLSDTGRLLGSPAYESEAMPDVAASAYPLIYGDFSGYWIVQRMGLSIQRFQDSNTGPAKVEYHVFRRVGGRVVEPWKFAVQKVSAS